jgi:hypothetical protein
MGLMSAIIWYLVMGSSYLGPFNEIACKRAAVELMNEAQCKQADYFMACSVDGRPGTYTACPHFTYPEITIR